MMQRKKKKVDIDQVSHVFNARGAIIFFITYEVSVDPKEGTRNITHLPLICKLLVHL